MIVEGKVLYYPMGEDMVKDTVFVSCVIDGEGRFKNCKFESCDVKANYIVNCEVVFSSLECIQFHSPIWVACSDITAEIMINYITIKGLYYEIEIGFPEFGIERSWIAVGCQTFKMTDFFDEDYMEKVISNRVSGDDLLEDFFEWYDVIKVFARKAIKERADHS